MLYAQLSLLLFFCNINKLLLENKILFLDDYTIIYYLSRQHFKITC